MNSGVPTQREAQSCLEQTIWTSENKQFLLHTDDTSGSVAVPEHSCKTKIAYFDLTKMAINKDVITLEVSMDHRRVVAVEINKPFQDLPSPRLDCSNIYPQVLVFVSTQEKGQVFIQIKVLIKYFLKV